MQSSDKDALNLHFYIFFKLNAVSQQINYAELVSEEKQQKYFFFKSLLRKKHPFASLNLHKLQKAKTTTRDLKAKPFNFLRHLSLHQRNSWRVTYRKSDRQSGTPHDQHAFPAFKLPP